MHGLLVFVVFHNEIFSFYNCIIFFPDTTSGSLNILTPSSTTSHYRDFTARLQERVHHQQRAGNCLKVPSAADLIRPSVVAKSKPSYLHLACSVNGYSNITTYNSKLRQKLNRSREASPGRPGNAMDMLRDCTDDAMAQRLNMDQSSPFFKTSFSETSISSQNVLTFSSTNRNSDGAQASKSYHIISNGTSDSNGPSPKSFIQQRVERLYGPGALAQGFFNQKRTTLNRNNLSSDGLKYCTTNGSISSVRSPESRVTTHQIIRKSQNGVTSETVFSSTETYPNTDSENDDQSLPVLRHLRPEFRAQLPILSPKRSVPFKSPETSPIGIDMVDRAKTKFPQQLQRLHVDERTKPEPVVTIIPIQRESETETKTEAVISLDNNCNNVSLKDLDNCVKVTCEIDVKDEDVTPKMIVSEKTTTPPKAKTNGHHQVQDGHYFLSLKQAETERLIKLAESAEEDLEKLLVNNIIIIINLFISIF